MTKILLVEDDKSLREIYGVRLLAEGYDIISAGDGEEALAVAIKDRPALIVSDVMMPKISGFDMLDILRSTTETRNIKVIMMTALSSEDQRKRGESLGADRYLVKSQVGIEDVVHTVHDVLGDAPTGTQAPPAPAANIANRPPEAAPSVSVPSRDNALASPAAPAQPTPPPQPSANPMPQPTAPFSSQRPSGLGDRVIQPLITTSDTDTPTIADQMNQELGVNNMPTGTAQIPVENVAAVAPTPSSGQSANTASEPTTNQAPTSVGAQHSDQLDKLTPDEADLTSHLNFEESSRAQASDPAQQPPQSPQNPLAN